MNDGEIKIGRKKYSKLQKAKEYYLNKKKELEELKNDPKVQQYIETVKYLDRHSDKEFKHKNMVERALGYIASKTEESNNIIVFLGFRDIYENSCVDLSKIVSAVFMDLETMEEVIIEYKYYNLFCKNRNIIRFDGEYTYHDSDFYMDKFFELRNEYLSSLIELDQEEAQERIMKR